MRNYWINTTALIRNVCYGIALSTVLLLTGCGTDSPASEMELTASAFAATSNAEAEYTVESARVGHIVPADISKARSSSVELPALQGREMANITYAPEVPKPIDRNYATTVTVEMDMHEVVKEVADGVHYEYWTFGGEAPGPMVRVREGDMVEFTLQNHPMNKTPHNIDLHSVTGPGGGAEATVVAPGQQATFSFRALNPGLYVYHCAMAPIDLHIANGMYGLILVEPKEGLPQVDREYYVLQSEFYTKGAYGEQGLQAFDRQKAMDERPDYVVFNGRVGALTGENALQAVTGDVVRLYVGNGGPNLTSSFHVIGEVMDRVYSEAGSVANQENVQTTLVPAGGATTVEFEVDVPGTYGLVDHAAFRMINKGAMAQLKVLGEENPEIFAAQHEVEPYQPTADAGQ